MRFRDYVSNNAYTKDVGTLFSGVTVAQIIGLAFMPVLTRLFLPEEFGVFYLFLTTSSILSLLVTGGYEKSFVLPRSDNDARQLLLFSIMLLAGVTTICFVTLLFLNQWGDAFFQTKHSRLILWLIPVYSFLFGSLRIFQNWDIRGKKYNWIAYSNVIRSGSLSGIQTGFGLFNSGSFGLVFGSCISQIFPLWFLIRKDRSLLRSITKNTFKEAYLRGKEYRSFPFLKMPSDLLNEISVQLPIYVLKAVFGNAVVGIYSLPQKIMSQPLKFIGQPASEVYYQRASKLRAHRKDLSGITYNTYKTLFLTGIIPFLIVLFWGPDIFSFVFGKEWVFSGRLAAWLSPWLLFVFAGSPISNIFIIKKKLRLSFFLNLFLLFVRLVSLLIGTIVFKDLETTVILFSGTSFIFWIFITFYSLYLGEVSPLKYVVFTVLVITVTFIPLGLIKLFLL